MIKPKILTAAILAIVVLAAPVLAQEFSNKGKKLVEYGWDVPSPAYLKQNIRTMEERPFDGVVFSLQNGSIGSSFDTTLWPKDKLNELEADIRQIKWKKFKYNFLCLYAASDFGMNWFDDAQWKIVLENARSSARLAKAGKCVGIVFDPEPYGKDPWVYPGDYPNKSLEEVTKQVRLRGKQWIRALQEKWPDMHLLLFYFVPGETDNHYYQLLGAFSNGLVEGSSDRAKIINGNESSYYHTTSKQYIDDWKTMRELGATQIDPKLKTKYNKIVQAGMALYIDQTLALREPQANYISYFMTPAERLKYFEHAVYWAMKTTDEYVWCYSERMNWWTGNFPQGTDQAIINARTKLESGKSLGYSLEDIVIRATAKKTMTVADRITRRFAVVEKIAATTLAPVIDGKLDDPAWLANKPLEKFLPAATEAPDKVVADTMARVTYDNNNLYVGIQASEPAMNAISATGSAKDSSVWNGDSVEVFISVNGDDPYDYRHFIVNPNNSQWDGKAPPESNDEKWNADWSSAVTKSADSWTVEMAIPWSAIGGYPANNTSRFINMTRQRKPVAEWSSWSSVVDGFLDAARFGSMMFRE